MHEGENQPWRAAGQLRAGARMLSLRDLHLPHSHISRAASGKFPAILPGKNLARAGAKVTMSGSVGRDCWQWWQGGGKRFESVSPCHVRDLRLVPHASAHWPRPTGEFRDHLIPRSDATVRPRSPAADAFAVMATEAEKSAVDQGHTAESAIAPPPAPAAAVAVAAPPLLPPAPPAVVATSAAPLPLSPAPPLSLPHAVPVSGAPVPVAQPLPVAQPPAQAVARGPALGTAVGAGPDSAHLVAPAAAPVNPVAQRLAESQIRAAVGANAAAHRGRGSPRRRPSSSYRSAHRGGRGGWWGGHGRGRGGPSEMQQLREDFPGMLAAAMRNALNGAPNLGSSPAPAAPAPAPVPVNAQVPAAPLAASAPHESAYPRAPAPGGDRAPPAYVRPVSASQYPPLPWIPPLPDTGFVGAGGGAARGAFVPPRRFAEAPSVQPPPPLPVPPAALRTGVAQVPTATLAQLWRLVECQQALTLILVNAHFAILQSPGSTLDREARGDCLAAAAQLAFLLLPLLGAPAMGGVAVSELNGTVQGLTAHLQAGGGIEAVGATALVVQQLWRTMRGILAALDAHLM
ncbi:unnamed protein product [Closterium sp. Naga37s-1]|nr:unnamed protein product [Closterium sp. Naga37s-1]